ncbi:MAG: aminotransferase class V-fold PLP-dependent enzyme [Oscillospiraceae bacterium]
MIYLDSAATSLQKPQSVSQSVSRAIKTLASPGRGCYRPAMQAADCVLDCRMALASYFGVDEPENVIFTFNATHALNIAINSLVSFGDRVVISGYEHNSVLRPLYAAGADICIVRTPLFQPETMLESFERELCWAKCAVCTHVSNVFGYVLPIRKIASLCRERGVPLIIDASQSAGVLPIDNSVLGAAFIAMPGHKGLLGPQGTGVLLCNHETRPLMHGGTGSNSSEVLMPDYLPERLEAGTHNVAGIAGLYQGLKFIASKDRHCIADHERRLKDALASQLSGIDGLRVFSTNVPSLQTGVLSVLHESIGADELAEQLGKRGICVRAGLHCSPLAHETCGTAEEGTLRFSFSPFNTLREVHMAGEAMKKIINNIAK